MKLYRIETQGLGTHYAVANNETEAYQIMRKWFDDLDYGFQSKRTLKTITLLADTYRSNDIENSATYKNGVMLFGKGYNHDAKS